MAAPALAALRPDAGPPPVTRMKFFMNVISDLVLPLLDGVLHDVVDSVAAGQLSFPNLAGIAAAVKGKAEGWAA